MWTLVTSVMRLYSDGVCGECVSGEDGEEWEPCRSDLSLGWREGGREGGRRRGSEEGR